MKKLFSSLARCESGTAAMEAVIVMPIAITLMAGGVEFGRIISAHSTADKALHAAARYLARVPETAVCGWGLPIAKNIAVYGKTTNTGAPLIPGMTPAHVTLTIPDCAAALPDPLVIELSAAVPFSLDMLSAINFSNSYTLNVKHQERHIGE